MNLSEMDIFIISVILKNSGGGQDWRTGTFVGVDYVQAALEHRSGMRLGILTFKLRLHQTLKSAWVAKLIYTQCDVAATRKPHQCKYFMKGPLS
jgi:hypothetical protein